MSSRLSVAVLAVFLAPTFASAADAKADAELAKVAQGMYRDLRAVTLENGLRVYLLPVKNSPVVTTMVAYRVGSADEEKDQTGLSHYLEHLLFKGTDKLLPGDVDRATQRNGGANNAYTTNDRTVYHFDFAADRWQIALEIEADRMRNVRIDAKHEFEQEKGAVIAELKRNEDGPWDLEQKAILPLLFPKDSPYSHPVIGQETHVRAATAEVIKRYYDQWYHPNNASLIVVGGFDPDQALPLIKKLFGPIPKGELPPRKPATSHKDRAGPVRGEFASKFELPRMLMGFNTCGVTDPDAPALSVIGDVLSDGRTARLYRKMVEGDRVATEIGAGNSPGRYPGWFEVDVEMLRGKDRKAIEETVFAELEKLTAEPIAAEELARARRKILAGFVFGRESVHGLAETVAQASTYPGVEDVAKYYQEYLDRVAKLTPGDIQRVAKKYFDRKRAVLVWSVPAEAKKGDAGEKGSGRAAGVSRLFVDGENSRLFVDGENSRLFVDGENSRLFVDGENSRLFVDGENSRLFVDGENSRLTPAARQERAGPAGGGTAFTLKDAMRVVLPNGLTLILYEDHRLPIVVARAAVRDATLREPVEKAGIATLVGNLLEEGTDQHAGPEIAALIENTGGSLGFSSGGGSLKVLTPDTALGLGLLFECLTRPSFPQEALDRQKDQQVAAIEDAETQPNQKARRIFRELVYGKHPYGRSALGTKAVVEKLTAADCKAFHAAAFTPDSTIVVIVGDFKADDMAKTIETLTADWKRSTAKQLEILPPPAPKGVEKLVSDPNAAQTHVYIGHIGITRKNPDYYKLEVMDNVLGVGPGFTDRLSASLRDRQGLAYTVNASIAGSAGSQPGTFMGYIGTFPESFVLARSGFLKEINKIRDEPPTKQEVDDAKKYLLGSQAFHFSTLGGIAGELLTAERYGLGFDVLETFRKEVEAVTPEDVQAMAKKYLDPKALVIVAVGPIDAEGKPLPKPKKGK